MNFNICIHICMYIHLYIYLLHLWKVQSPIQLDNIILEFAYLKSIYKYMNRPIMLNNSVLCIEHIITEHSIHFIHITWCDNKNKRILYLIFMYVHMYKNNFPWIVSCIWAQLTSLHLWHIYVIIHIWNIFIVTLVKHYF